MAPQAPRDPARVLERRLRCAVAAGRRAAARTRGPRSCCASAPGSSPAIVAMTWRGRSVVSSAQSTTAPRERSQPRRVARRTISRGSRSVRARRSSRNEPRRFCSTSSRASLDRDLGEAGDRGEVQELGGVGRRPSGPPSGPCSSTTAPTSSSPEEIGASAATAFGTLAGRSRHPVVDVAAHRLRHVAAGPGSRDAPRRSRRGTTIATGPPGRLGGQLGDAAEPVAAEHRVDHREVDAAQALDERSLDPAAGGAAAGPGAGPIRRSTHRARPPRARRGGPGGSPRRPPRSGRGRPPRPAARTPCRRRPRPSGRA